MTRSRLMSVREKRELKQAIILIIATIVLLVAFIFWGLPAIAGFVGNNLIKSDGKTTDSLALSPTAPILTDIPEATNSASIDVNGTALAGGEVSLFVNGVESSKIAVPDSGEFVIPNVKMPEGSNKIYAICYSSATKLTSDNSREHVVLIDLAKPKLEVKSPASDSVFHGERERLVNILGSYDEDGTRVYVGDRMAIGNADNTFNVSYQLVEGDQEIKIVARDKAGNETEQILKLRWER